MSQSSSDLPPPVWLITGCSSGFGRELAKQTLEAGFRAVVTARQLDTIADLVAGGDGRALGLVLDVTDKDQVAAAVKETLAVFGRIDVLVNNAGFGYFSGIEEADEADVRAMFEANFFGLAEMTRAVLPTMRAQRSGRIVNISSIGGLVAYPGVGYYNATKFAVEGFSEALAKEVAPLGLGVLIVEPGPFRTEWAGRSAKHSPREILDYAATVGVNRRENQSGSGKQPGDPSRAAQAIIAAVLSPTPPRRLLLGRAALDAALEKMEGMREEFEAWRQTTIGADFDSDAEPGPMSTDLR